MHLKYNEIAAEKGLYIVSACGLVSILTDMGILHFLKNFDGEYLRNFNTFDFV